MGSKPSVKDPKAGESTLLQDVRLRLTPVTRSNPSFILGKRVSVGRSKLCQSTRFTDPSGLDSRRAKFPESSRTRDGVTGVLGNLQVSVLIEPESS
ncbi:hypothetical protein PanWU01x14_339960 [Parasponia andersonii]|uniref:Uncharacterized protein n=1 Tax=Parasponia andersonii TaxID=3476 RepID=A0A2P5AEM2_PARAD|nr:hypothetical protein PanWU01x14_339960 [Parasponia andersonii]